jgi:hypothetical protein
MSNVMRNNNVNISTPIVINNNNNNNNNIPLLNMTFY